MTINAREEAIIKYAEAWVNKDFTGIEKYFDSNVNIKDYFAEEIKLDLDSLKTEIQALTMRNTSFKLINFVHQGDITVVEWELEYTESGKNKRYEGLSLIKFSPNNLIVEIREHATEVKAD